MYKDIHALVVVLLNVLSSSSSYWDLTSWGRRRVSTSNLTNVLCGQPRPQKVGFQTSPQLSFHIEAAHSFPPCSLDPRSTELIVTPKKVVGCRGGFGNVEGC